MKSIINKLYSTGNVSDEELLRLIESDEESSYLAEKAEEVRIRNYGNNVFIRGLIEISNYCKNDCYYCGIRASNRSVSRYRLTREQILECCRTGKKLGFMTFVLQGGEDPFFTDDIICDIVSSIKHENPECAVTLSIGEKPYSSYKAYFDAGADRYLLRHETADSSHYCKLHPEYMKLSERKKCLYDLKEIGYQTGSGFMVGSPYQTSENLLHDIRFLQELKPEMIGIGPFIKHHQTPFRDFPDGSAELCLRLLSILRLMFPDVLLPATTALGSLLEDGRERGFKAGANVVMPNLSPSDTRKLYDLYDNKAISGAEAAESLDMLRAKAESAGCRIVCSRGDHKDYFRQYK